MKRRILFLTFVFAGLCLPASGQNFIDKFLDRYKPTPTNVIYTAPLTQDRLPALIQNGEIPLSITDLINLTLENNLDIAVNRLSPLASQYAIRTNYRPFEPMLNLGATVSRGTERSRTQLTGVESVSQLNHTYTAGFSQSLKTGADIAVDFNLVRTSTNDAFSTFNPSWVGRIQYSFTQRLLNGFGRDVNTRGIRVAQNNKSISEVEFEREVIDLVTQAQKSYWDLVFTSEDLKVKQNSLALAQKTLSDNQRQVEVGTLARIDLVQSETQVATRNEDVIVSDFTKSQLQDQIKKVLTRQADPGLVLARLTPTQRADIPGESDILPAADAIRVALENRPELRQAILQLRNSEIEIQYAKNQLMPTLDITARFTQNGVGGTQTLREGIGFPPGPIIGVIPGGFGSTFGDLWAFNDRGYSLGFAMQIPLSNKSQKAEYSRVTVEKKTREENIKALELQIALEVRNAITAVAMNKARITAASRSRELAEMQYAAEQRRFELGASTVRFVLEEQDNLQRLQTNEIAALVNYRKALVDYDHSLGVTLKKNNISIEKSIAALK
jgi:outer membrane protein TolC